jgi:hypothetical protein
MMDGEIKINGIETFVGKSLMRRSTFCNLET